MGKKKKVAKADDTKPEVASVEDSEKKEGAEDSEKKDVDTEANGGSKEASMEAYKAAAVLFFTRGEDGKVAKVLLAVEERKVQARMMGLEGNGKVVQRVVVFPQGRKEKKDKNDPVETAKREYIEETTNYGDLSRYLDFADFGGGEDDDDPSAAVREKDETWTGTSNVAIYFAPAGMVVLFCEVKPKDAEQAPAERVMVKPKDAEQAEGELVVEPAAKKPKLDAQQKKPSPSYRVGKMGHLQPCWIEADALRRALLSGDRAPTLDVNGESARLFPTNVSALKLPEVRALLDLPVQKPTSP